MMNKMGSTAIKTLYDTDFVEWASLMAELLRGGRRAVRDVLAETGLEDRGAELSIPAECPWTLGELLDGQVGGLDRQ